MTSWRVAALFAVLLACGPWNLAGVSAQQPSDYERSWSLDRRLSQFPSELGFSASFIPQPDPRDTVGGRRALPPRIPSTTAEDSARVRFLTDEVRLPPDQLTIEVTPATVTITPDRGAPRTLQPGKRDEVVTIGPVTAIANSMWDAGRLIVVYRAEASRFLRYIYSVSANPARLTVDVEFIEQGSVGDRVRRVYELTPPPSSSSATPAPPAGAPSSDLPDPLGAREPAPPRRSLRDLASGAFPPSSSRPPGAGTVDERPDAALAGLNQFSVVVEELGAQAAKCGLTQAAVEDAVTSRLTAAGFRVVRESDEDTYLYVSLGTVTTSAGLCVTRYDLTLYSHAAARLPHTPAAVPLQAELLHRGGMTGGNTSTHAGSVMKSVLEEVDTMAERLKGANR